MNKQRIVAGLASVAMASTLVACSGGSSSKLMLRINVKVQCG